MHDVMRVHRRRLGRLTGSMTPFPPQEDAGLYGTPAGYLAAYRLRLDELVAERWILPADAERECWGRPRRSV